MVQGLQELLTLTFRPQPQPKQPPKRLYRVGWWKPVQGEYRRIRHTYSRFEDRDEAVAFAAEKGGKVRAEKWIEGQWIPILTDEDRERQNRLFAKHTLKKARA